MNEGVCQKCSRCGELKPIGAFSLKSRASGVLHSYCRDCHAAWNRAHYDRNRATYMAAARRNNARCESTNLRGLIEYLLQHPCVDCGESDPLVLDFDHRDRASKRMAVSDLLRHTSWKYVEAEVAKCDVRCANCHRRRTARQLGWRRAALVLVLSAGAEGLEPPACRFGDDRSTN
jgi:hypothetical protein